MNSRLRDVLILVTACLVLSSWIPATSQVLKGSISGTVLDPQGAVVSGAQVKVTHTATGAVATTTSDAAGIFRFNLLAVGDYKVEISAKGFKTAAQSGILVAAGSDNSVGPIRLTVGETTTTVEVVGAAPLIESTQAQITNTFTGVALTEFAGVQENQGLDNLALFVPGVVSSRDQGFSNTNGGGGFSTNGIRGRNNDQEIDGQNNNDNSIGGPALFLSDPEFVQQYVLITNNFGPEYGRNAGSVVNLITKSGSNNWHGSTYINENNSYLNSLSSGQFAAGLKKPPRSNDEFGGFTLGGPIVKNRAFFFAGFDQEILSTNSVDFSTQLTPTPAGLATLAACFPTGASANAISAMTKFGPFGISAGHPVALAPSTATIAGCAGVEVAGVSRTLPTPFHGYNFITREDVQISSRDNFSGRYLYNKSDNFNASDNGAAGYVFDIPALSQAVLLSETHNFTSRMVNEFRVGFDRLNVEFGGGQFGTEPTTGNILNAVTNVTFQSQSDLGFGVATNLPQGRVVNTWQAQDNWNYVLGRHTLKAGVNWTYQQSPNVFLPTINGQYIFPDLSGFIQNQPTAVALAKGNPELGLKEFDTFFYFGDDWKLARNLTVNLGLTYSYYGQPINQLHTLGLTQQQGPNPLWDPKLPTSVTTPTAIAAFNRGIGPSIGMAYTPQWGGFLTGRGKMVIRGGYRLSYDPAFYNILLNNYEGAPSVLQAVLPGGPAALQLPATPTGPNVRNSVGPLLPLGQLDPRTLGEVTVAPNFRPDEVHAWSIGFERELTKNAAIEMRYVGNIGRDLFQTANVNPYVGFNGGAIPTNTLNLVPGVTDLFPNAVPTGTKGCTTPSVVGLDGTLQSSPALGRVNCNQGILLSRNNSGYSNYNAIQTEFRADNLFKQLTLRAGYTRSKTLDNVSEIFGTFGGGTTFSLAQNPLNTGAGEYSFSGLDIPNQFTLNMVEQLPFFKEQHGVIGHAFGGWGFSGSYIWESGQAFTPETIVFSQLLEPADFPNGADLFDVNFNNQFNNGLAPARPFLGNRGAPVDSVGIMAGDVCNLAGLGCSLAPTQLVSLNDLNATGAVNAVSKNQVRYIANTGIADQVFGTPFGNTPRNAGRDAPLNYLNTSVTKMVKISERTSFEFRFTMLNTFNHPNFATVNPFIENAGVGSFGQAFALPKFTGDSIPGSNLTASRRVYFGGILRF